MGDDESGEDMQRAAPPLSISEMIAQSAYEREQEIERLRTKQREVDAKVPVPIPKIEYAVREQFDACLRPREALARFPFTTELAIVQIFRELNVRRVVAIADQIILRQGAQTTVHPIALVPTWVWNREIDAINDFWDTGYYLRGLPSRDFSIDAGRSIEIFDIRFWPDGLPEQTKNLMPPISTEVIVPAIGGRPPKPWWDDLWAEMARQLYNGDLKPARQADIESAMATWLTGQGHSASEGAIRTRARKLFAAISQEDNN